ncbi:signal recognition particle protein [Fimbriimonas ginsengisoli]|uniref:Signal recognition particle protein n=1 Tax=Fimbriimonas ginsengisoli Gsoil 348 TaxID=661478 RepID=A0A068NYT8_FIMGI|nr:signal recognition particle protein [Fimbriimonas ginsengisoli]AIE87399.1 Signal recognition particle, subunit Ffh SRP54 [Fimbriimonas ginsengisoli Gsoil 348]
MLDTLTRRLAGILANLRKQGKLTEDDVNEMLREVRVALLEADVNFAVAKSFIGRVREKAVGEEVFASLTADQTIIKIVRDELTEMLGTEQTRFDFGSQPPTVVLMCGLQGSGKTTTTAKLAKWLVAQGKKPMLAACDVQRPAAIKQLQVLGEQVDVPVFAKTDGSSPVQIAREALERCKYLMRDVLIVDTAGRLSIDEALMAELKQIHDTVRPNEAFLVLDSTTGQEAVSVAKAFHDLIPITGVIFTKLDGDTRGGAVLSVREATGVPVRFTGVGEQVDALEPFYPDRMAQRIIGMGDVLGIIEKAELAFEGEDMTGLEAQFKRGDFDFNTMLDQFRMMRKMGPIKNVLKMIPGLGAQIPEEALEAIDDKGVNRIEAVIFSMTAKERSNPDIINSSRRKRIAAGSGTSVEEVNHLIRQLYEMRRNMKQLGKMQKQFMKKGRKR